MLYIDLLIYNRGCFIFADMHQYSYESETEDLPDIYPPKRMRIARLKAEMKCSSSGKNNMQTQNI